MIERARYISEEGPIRVLHVDDDACFLKTAKPILEMQGTFQVDTASCVEEAWEKMKKAKYDVVVCDYQMPRKDGLQFLKELRQKDDNIPFIVFTGKGREEVVIKALNLGADHYENKNGNPDVIYSELSHDIINAVRTRRTEQELRIQREELQIILDSMPAKIWYKDRNNRLVRVNKAFAEYMGVSKENLEGKPLCDLFPPDIAQKCWEEDKEVIMTGQPKTDIIDHHESAQGVRWFSTSKVPCKEKDGIIIGTINFSVDITERQKAEEALLAEQDRLEIVTESIGAGLAVISEDYRTLWANRVLKRIFGDVEGKICYSTYNRRSEICPRCGVREVFEAGKDRAVHEQVGKDVDGKIIWSEIIATPVKDKSGKVTAAVELVVPVTERKKTEGSLRASEEKFKNIFESATDVMVLFDATGRILDVNKKAVEAFGGSKGELVGKHFTRVCLGIMSPTQISKVAKGFAAGLANKKPNLDVSIKNKKGQTTLLECSGSLLKLDDKSTRLLVVGRNITERKRAEEELTRSEAKYRSLVELAPDGIVAVNAEGTVTSANRSFLTLVGYDSEEIVGKPFTELKTMQMEDIPKFQGMFKSLMKGESASPVEFLCVRRDGTSRWAEVHPSLLVKDGNSVGAQVIMRDVSERKNAEEVLKKREAELSAIIENTSDSVWSIDNKGCLLFANTTFKRQFLLTYGVELKEGMDLKEMVPKAQIPFWVETHNRAVKGGQFSLEQKLEIRGVSFDFEISVNPIINENGETMGAAYFSRDITERKKVLEKLRVLNEKLSVVGKLTRHDVRNKLSAVVGNTYLAKKTLPNDHKALAYLKEI